MGPHQAGEWTEKLRHCGRFIVHLWAGNKKGQGKNYCVAFEPFCKPMMHAIGFRPPNIEESSGSQVVGGG